MIEKERSFMSLQKRMLVAVYPVLYSWKMHTNSFCQNCEYRLELDPGHIISPVKVWLQTVLFLSPFDGVPMDA